MTGKDFEKGIFGLVEGAKTLVGDVWSNMAHPSDEAVAEAGIDEPKTFSVPLEEGGRSRFLPALAIAAAAVNPDPNVEPRDVFEEFNAVLAERGRPLWRSNKPTSTRNTIKALYEEADAVPEYLEGVKIEPCLRTPADDVENGIEELSIPTTSDRSVLLMPFNRRMFNTTEELSSEVSSIPLWGVAFGVYQPVGGKKTVGGVDMSPVSVLYKVAFPVPPGMVGRENEGSTEPIPALMMMNMFLRDEIVPGHKNMAYIVSADKS